ncbi:3-oxoacyl-[acyl-carrier protein] reductase [Microvirga flocculans]|uniref:3-oxoacyl-[acyl-carrier protein] reductase n=1 Tax=Microvirga flocculans TaxID=217168 RepID=A0A7W6IC57_9HYPH|nr:SDR family NAD(P)-dependent oxidoreductase [Microvirga flocculans]MBB4038719.1 3-oxoacyl-[acyl-carrier protein] reductase [Microvirga flocculans]
MLGLALITGGGRGIGLGIAKRLASDGWKVAIADLTLEQAEAGVAELAGTGHSAWQVDVSSESSVENLFDGLEASHGPVTALVCNAGLLIMVNNERPPLVDLTVDDWNKTHAVNALGTFLCCRAYARRRHKVPVANGRVVTTSSVAAELGGYRSSSSYISSKSAVLGFTKAVARELAPLGITVNCVAPGVIDAPMLHITSTEENRAASFEKLSQSVPLGRLGRPDDLAGAVSFLLSPDASYITGATIDVNGGYRMA